MQVENNITITKLYVIKNRECYDSEKLYYQEFLDVINDSNIDSRLREDKLAMLVLKNCRNKIVSRAVKLQKAMKDYKSLYPTWVKPPTLMEKEVSTLKSLYQPSKPDATSWSDFLDDFLLKGLAPNIFQSTTDGVPLHLVSYFVSSKSLINSISSPKVLRRLRKLGIYAQTIVKIRKYVDNATSQGEVHLHVVSFKNASCRCY